MNWAVIMAGGRGTRFWPLSNPHNPKQFLKLIGDKTPAQNCIDRLRRVVPMDRIYMVASDIHRDVIARVLPDFPADHILWEPVGRNTAPCIAWVTEIIRAQDPCACIGVFPSDHEVADADLFAQSLQKAYEAAPGHIVLFGIAPTRPETGYGYIEQGASVSSNLYRVASFREKPDIQTAQRYLAENRYLWNSGMFIYDATVMHDEIAAHVPQIAEKIAQIVADPSQIATIFPTLLSISIDYAVMEHTQKAVVLRAEFPWDDLGTWDAIRRYFPVDDDKNASTGNVVFVDSSNNFVYACDQRQIALLGLDDIIVVSTPSAVLVMPANRSQDVRLVQKKLE